MKKFNEFQFGINLVNLIDDYSKRPETEYNQGYLDALQTVSEAFTNEHYTESDESDE